MSQNDPRQSPLRQRYADIFPENANDPDLERLIHDLDAVMNAPVLSEQQGFAQTAQPDFADIPISHRLQQGYANRLPQRHIGPWMGSVAALLVVSLLSGLFLTRVHGLPGQTGTVATSTPMDTATCDPVKVKANLPAGSDLLDFAMVSPTEGWAVGTIQDPAVYAFVAANVPSNPLILHFHNCIWSPVPTNFSNAGLSSVSMGSATDGWAVGGMNNEPLVLHYANGIWSQARLPGESTLDGAYTTVRMLSASDGWIVIVNNKNAQGLSTNGLLHLANGRWSGVSVPFPVIEHVLPVASDEAWFAGSASTREEDPVLYHYKAGVWTRAALPVGVMIDHLRMVSPQNIWASGHISAPSDPNDPLTQTMAVLHYDGSQWQQVAISAPGKPQIVEAFDGSSGWAFIMQSARVANDSGYDVGSAYVQKDGKWYRVEWPLTTFGATVDLGGGKAAGWSVPGAQGIDTLTRVEKDTYWTIGAIKRTEPNSDGTGTLTYPASILLYFANGTWHEYGG